MNYCIDLICRKAFCIFIFFHFPDSRLSVLKGFHFYFRFLTWVKTENCRVSFVTFSCCVSIVVPFLVCINIDSFGVIICYNLVTGNTQPKIFFPLFSRNENQGKLRVCFKLQVGNPWTNLAEIWPTYCQIVFLKNHGCEFWFLFSFSSKSIFFTGSANDLLSLTSTAYNKRTHPLDKNLKHVQFFSRTC